MSKRHLMQRAEDEELVRKIEGRWKSVDLLRAWCSVAPELRKRLVADLEEEAREVGAQSADADARIAACAALEALPDVIALFTAHIASDDIHALLELANRTKQIS